MAAAGLADALLDALPQTQCRRCGYDDCRGYAEAMAAGEAGIDRCPPGGAEGIARLAVVSGRPVVPLDAECGVEGPRSLAVVDEARCIGCALCLKACPVDAIVGGARHMHVVVPSLCTGCELCLPVCPVDCIELVGGSGDRTGWQAWSDADAALARERYGRHQLRVRAPEGTEVAAPASVTPALAAPNVASAVAAALARARRARTDEAASS